MDFVKTLPNLTEQQTELMFNHSMELFEVLRSNKNIVFPCPISFVDKNIKYEFLDLPEQFIERLQRRESVPIEMGLIGNALGLIHSYKISGQRRRLLHGDFVPHNIFCKAEKIFIIDPHPPESLDFREDIIYGDGRREVMAMVYGIFSDIGLKKALLHYLYYCGTAFWFLSGYEQGGGIVKPFVVPAVVYVKDAFIIKRRNGFGIISALAHCIGCGVAALSVIWSYKCKRKN